MFVSPDDLTNSSPLNTSRWTLTVTFPPPFAVPDMKVIAESALVVMESAVSIELA